MKITIGLLTGAGAVLAIGASVLAVSPAHAATTAAHVASPTSTSNWSGYYKETDAPIGQAEATFTVPKVSCKDSRGPAPAIGGKHIYQGAMWVGIGGDHTDGFLWLRGDYAWLEQDGVVVECDGLNATPLYMPFWEIAGAPKSVAPQHEVVYDNGNATVKPGDLITAKVYTPAYSPHTGQWLFEVDVVRNGVLVNSWTEYRTLPKGSYTGNPGVSNALNYETVEVITECPSFGNDLFGFVNLGTVRYSYADYFVTDSEDDGGYSIASTPIDLRHPDPGPIAVSPGSPYTSEFSDVPGDAFNTSYSKNWWK